MKNTDPRIDAYIAKSAEFARPILVYLRELIHETCPEVTETIKWSMPAFDYKGPLCLMAAFKAHCGFVLWKRSLIPGIDAAKADEALGSEGKITQLSDLPAKKILIGYLREGMKLNEAGIKVPRPPVGERKELVIPPELTAALKKHPAARKTFEGFSYSKKKDYAEWIAEAKTEATRQKRLQTAIEWMNEGKERNWKYLKC